MGTPFITLLEPTRLDGYNPRLPHDQQPAYIPSPFKDTMEVRERVFVKEQGFPLEFEYDADDARSCHWIMYASVNTTTRDEERDEETDELIRPRLSTTQTIPIGTLRIVPFPHPPHPPNGARYVGGVLQPIEDPGSISATQQGGAQNGNGIGAAAAAASRRRALSLVDERRMSAPLPFGHDRQTDFHNGKEPYVKLGRLAVVPEFRGHRVAEQLWSAAKLWLETNPTYFNPSVKELGMDVMKVDNIRDVPEWNGLVCVHSQVAVVKVYERWGFQVDKAMGKFFEENVPHVGMWNRLKLKASEPMATKSKR
ncbi:acetyltransferase [Xylaria telfairii]|nr:acetyltransferase [Xylaria telfairii]